MVLGGSRPDISWPFTTPFPHGDDELRVPLPCWLARAVLGRGWSVLDPCLPHGAVLPPVLRAARTTGLHAALSWYSELREQEKPFSFYSF